MLRLVRKEKYSPLLRTPRCGARLRGDAEDPRDGGREEHVVLAHGDGHVHDRVHEAREGLPGERGRARKAQDALPKSFDFSFSVWV